MKMVVEFATRFLASSKQEERFRYVLQNVQAM